MNRGAPKIISEPRIGFWAVRLVAGGVEVGARIFRVPHVRTDPADHTNISERSTYLAAEINGEPASLEEVWTRRGRAIDEETYHWLVRDRAWARRYARETPEGNPTRPADLRAMPAVMPPSRRR